MTASVLIDAGTLDDRLPRIVTSLDDQSLPYSRYEVIYLDPGSSERTSRRLRELVVRRPNVTLLPISPGTEGNAWKAGVEAAQGDYVLLLGPDDLLFPGGLQSLLDATAGGAQLVVATGSESGPAGFVSEDLSPGMTIDASDPAGGIAMLAPFALIRRTTLTEVMSAAAEAGRDAGFRSLRAAVLEAAGASVVATSPVGLGMGPSGGQSIEDAWSDLAEALGHLDAEPSARLVAAQAAATFRHSGAGGVPRSTADQIVGLVRSAWTDRDVDTLPYAQRDVVRTLVAADVAGADSATKAVADIGLAVPSTSAEWSAGVLYLTVMGVVQGLPRADPRPDFTLAAAIRNLATGIEYVLPSTADAARDSAGFIVHASVDAALAAAGKPLERGTWEILVRLNGFGSDRTISAALPQPRSTTGIASGAVVDGTPVSVFAVDGRLRLDVGARGHGFLGARLSPEQATINETAAGALLTITLPDAVARGDAILHGALFLGKFRAPAVLRTTGSSAQIECYLNGLAGVSRLEASFGGTKQQPLGLQLRIGPAGEMTIEAAPKVPSKKPAAKKPAAKKQGGKAPVAKKPVAKKATGSAGKGKPEQRRSGRIISRVPKPLQPWARAASRSPLIKSAYRKATGRG
ncbi:glycosyltransferase family 2 protein [Microlunatus endophyticus]|uniref:glycosyltransferase family 2 protein n=1 Tax=Microlunatus endophyticus TaxID=1716077 RepID=UPI001E3C0EF1|nr:glycosyltransferase [Microlunatus endophyticus]